MTKALYYPGANRTAQWAFSKYPGDLINTNTVVLHTTETRDWPGYGTGYYPNLTYHPGADVKWRQHLPLNRSGRALENRSGGVDTNTLNCIQIEMVGTCDASYKKRYPSVMFYDEPSNEVIEDLAHFAAFMYEEWGVKLQAAPKWLHYDDSYGSKHGQRFTFAEWEDFYGWCGHEHVPENVHGDPGAFPINKVLTRAEEILHPTPTPKPAPKPAPTPTPTPEVFAAMPAQLYRVKDQPAIYAHVPGGAIHVLNPTDLHLGIKDGTYKPDIIDLTEAEMKDLLEKE